MADLRVRGSRGHENDEARDREDGKDSRKASRDTTTHTPISFRLDDLLPTTRRRGGPGGVRGRVCGDKWTTGVDVDAVRVVVAGGGNLRSRALDHHLGLGLLDQHLLAWKGAQLLPDGARD